MHLCDQILWVVTQSDRTTEETYRFHKQGWRFLEESKIIERLNMRAVRLLETSRMNNSATQRRDPGDLKSQVFQYSF